MSHLLIDFSLSRTFVYISSKKKKYNITFLPLTLYITTSSLYYAWIPEVCCYFSSLGNYCVTYPGLLILKQTKFEE